MPIGGISTLTENSIGMNNIQQQAAQCRTLGINDIPADVLLVILRDVFKAARPPSMDRPFHPSSDEIFLDPLRALWGYTRPGKDALTTRIEHPMPECLASVCTRWREVMSNVAAFWPSFVIWTGRDPTPISRIEQYLAWSGDHPLDIFVLRRYDPSVHDPAENAHMHSIFELLSPQMRRWRVVVVKCLNASSLPRPRFELVGHADQLTRLNLDSIIDDLPPEPSPPPSLWASFTA